MDGTQKTWTKAEAEQHLAKHDAGYKRCLAELRRLNRDGGNEVTDRVRHLQAKACRHGEEVRKTLDILLGYDPDHPPQM